MFRLYPLAPSDVVIGFTGYLVNKSLNGQIAQQESGATIVLEHCYYGLSTPAANISAQNLKYHTIQQAIDDLAYFSKQVQLPMPGGDSVGPDVAPWILMVATPVLSPAGQ